MASNLTQYYEEEKQRTINACIACGDCVRVCPAASKIDSLNTIAPEEVQQSVIDFLNTGIPTRTVFDRAFSCMQCWTCTEDCCPVGLDPQLINETIKWEYRRNGIKEHPYSDPQEPVSTQRVIASILASPSDFERMCTPKGNADSRYIFFPGCNVYWQPDKLLSALDIFDQITTDYAYVPGGDYCCGNIHLTYGAIEKADSAMTELTAKLSSYDVETVVFWCSNCYIRYLKTLPHFQKIPLRVITFTEFVAENLDKLKFTQAIPKTVTLHEICKMGILGLEIDAPRNILKSIPGINLVEIPRHGFDTICCGSMLGDYFPNTFERWRADRLTEAEQTGAEVLVDICHACHEAFVNEEGRYNYSIANYITLVAEATGIPREDRYKKYKQWGNVDRIIADVKDGIEKSPYSRDIIVEALRKVFSK